MERNTLVGLWRGLLLVVLVGAVLVAGFGAWLALDDLETRGEMFDGLGFFLGLLIVAGGAVAGVPALVALLLRTRHARASEILSLVVGIAVTGIGLVPLTAGSVPWSAFGAAVGVALSVTSVQLLRRPAGDDLTLAKG